MSTEERLAELEARLQRAEDQLAITNLLNSYGPLVDSGWSDEAPKLWAEGGGYSYALPGGGSARLAQEEMHKLFESENHIQLINTGAAHFTAMPKITIQGDTASAVGYSFVIRREGERWFIWRGAINEWSFFRTSEGWRIKERENRALDGSPESHALMRRVAAI